MIFFFSFFFSIYKISSQEQFSGLIRNIYLSLNENALAWPFVCVLLLFHVFAFFCRRRESFIFLYLCVCVCVVPIAHSALVKNLTNDWVAITRFNRIVSISIFLLSPLYCFDNSHGSFHPHSTSMIYIGYEIWFAAGSGKEQQSQKRTKKKQRPTK